MVRPARPPETARQALAPSVQRNREGESSNSGDDGLLRLGRISASHGLQGAVRVRMDDPESTILTSLKRLFVETAKGWCEFALRRTNALGRGQFRTVLEGIDDADAAQALKGCAVAAALSDLPPLGEGEFYYFQLIGAEAMLADGRRLGIIADIFSTGAHDIWVVRDGEREVLVPVIADIVKAMDISARRVTIEPLPGLLD